MKLTSIDVIVVGAGPAGMMAALTAADEGAKVLLMEKTEDLGGSWHLAGGSTSGAATKMQFEAGIFDDTPDRFYRDCMQESRARSVCDSEVLWYYCQHSGKIVDWLDSIGAYPKEFRGPRACIYGEPWTINRSYFTEKGIQGGDKYLRAVTSEFEKRVQRGDVEVMLNTRVTDLLYDKQKKITGVKAKDAKGEKEYKAPAVILCSGGFTNNPSLIRKYKWPNAVDTSSVGWKGNEGDCLAMCEQIGAPMVNMEQEMAPYPGGIADPNNPGRQYTAVNMDAYPGAIWVDVDGKRVVNEEGGMRMPKIRLAVQNAKNMTLYVIFDKNIMDENKSILLNMFDAGRTWEEFEKMAEEGSMVKKANTPDDLAQKLGINASGFKETVTRYNGFVSSANDPDFGRQELKYKIENPPYYGIKTVPIVVKSTGGPAHNDRQQIVDTTGKIIQGLYCAGEFAGYSGFGTGGGNTSGLVFGQRAGQMAAQYALRLK